MNNEELRAAISDTRDQIKHAAPQSKRMPALNLHLGILLKEQQRRALERKSDSVPSDHNE